MALCLLTMTFAWIKSKAIGKQTEPFASVPGAIFLSFSQDVNSWPIPILLLLFMPSGPRSERKYEKN